MRIIAVIDLLGGQAVHARAGRRDAYAPVSSVAGGSIEPGSVRDLARFYVDSLGVGELYVADLDAILGRPPDDATARRLASLGVPLWVDAGIRSAPQAVDALNHGASRVIVGLETLPSFRALAEICASVRGVRPHESGGGTVAFSLDLRDGLPLVSTDSDIAKDESIETLVARAVEAGATSVIVLDLARVGTGVGVDAGVVARVRRAAPGLELVAGGGIRTVDDINVLERAGCDAVLVATALQNGVIGVRRPAQAEACALRPATGNQRPTVM